MNFFSDIFNTISTGARDIGQRVSGAVRNIYGGITTGSGLGASLLSGAQRLFESPSTTQSRGALDYSQPSVVAQDRDTGAFFTPADVSNLSAADIRRAYEQYQNPQQASTTTGGSTTVGSTGKQKQTPEMRHRAFTKEYGTAAPSGRGGFDVNAFNLALNGTAQSGAAGGGISNNLGLIGVGPTGGVSTPATSDERDRATRNTRTVEEIAMTPAPFPLRAPEFTVQTPTQPVVQSAVSPSAAESEVLSGGLSGVTFEQAAQQLTANYFNYLGEEAQKIPANPVEETLEQQQFLDAIPEAERFDVRAAMDEIRSSLGLPQLERDRLELQANISAINRAYDDFVQDIKKNPDLPAGLAKRRLEALNMEQKDQILRMTDLLEQVNMQVEQANTRLNQEFQILQVQLDEEERMRDNRRQTLQLLASTGAIGGLSDIEIRQWSQATGISTGALKRMRDDANTPEMDITTFTDNAGNVRGVDKNTGQTVWTIPGAGKSSGGTSVVDQDYREDLVSYLTDIRNDDISPEDAAFELLTLYGADKPGLTSDQIMSDLGLDVATDSTFTPAPINISARDFGGALGSTILDWGQYLNPATVPSNISSAAKKVYNSDFIQGFLGR